MIIGDHHAVAANEHPGAERVLDALTRNAPLLTEKAPEKWIVEEGRYHLFDPVTDIDVHDSRRRLLHHGREGLLDRGLALRHDLGHHFPLGGGETGGRQKNCGNDQAQTATFPEKNFQKCHLSLC